MVTDVCIASAKLFRKPMFVTDIGGGGVCISSYLSRIGLDTRHLVRQFLLFSAYSAQSYTRFLRRVRVIYGGVNTELFRPLGVARSRDVLFVGRLISAKGVNYLIEGLDPAVALRIVGQPYDEPYYRLLQHMARGKTVTFVADASDEDLVREYSSALVTVVPSVLTDVHGNSTTGELLNLSALESMACGTPVIATRCGALPEIIDDGVTGFLVPPNDPAAIRERIRFFLDRPDVAQAMGSAGRERVLSEFTWDRVASRCLQAYREALGS
jgi:glycosyltransferase involved in cell wall biosynthesis